MLHFLLVLIALGLCVVLWRPILAAISLIFMLCVTAAGFFVMFWVFYTMFSH